jgi:hypothetical protein
MISILDMSSTKSSITFLQKKKKTFLERFKLQKGSETNFCILADNVAILWRKT